MIFHPCATCDVKADYYCSVEPFRVLAETVLPTFASTARDQISLIIEQSRHLEAEIPIQDGFDLYKEMVDFRRTYTKHLPQYVLTHTIIFLADQS